MTAEPAGSRPEHAGRFPVVTALEVIEHVEDLHAFFAGIHAVMADRGVFVGYFPSADATAFGRAPDYHWLTSSFEHLVYPSADGIRTVLAPHFGRNVHVATFLTRQGKDVIPNSIVAAIKGDPDPASLADVVEVFRQAAYLNDRAVFDLALPRGPAALAPAWDAAAAAEGGEGASNVPYVVGTLCAKFGEFGAARHLRRDDRLPERLDGARLADLLVMAMHEGGIDWMRTHLPAIGPRIPQATLVSECHGIVARYDAAHPRPQPVMPTVADAGGSSDAADATGPVQAQARP